MITRRGFLTGLTSTVGAAALGIPRAGTAEPPPETTRLTIARASALCFAPQYVAETLLHAEGFADVEYVTGRPELSSAALVAAGDADISLGLAASMLVQIDAGAPVVLLAGGHVGCYELFGTGRVRRIRDLKAKNVAVPALGTGAHLFLSTMLAYVGIDPHRDVNWRTHPWTETVQLLAEGNLDAFLGFPPEPQELRAKRIGHVIVNTAVDRPWSQYFCCMVGANREFVQKHPVATKRALRAIVKAADLCARDPDAAARILVNRGNTTRYEYAAQLMRDIPYGKWREYDPEDTVRFFALKLHEVGTIKSAPQKVIARGTDWRFLTELKNELKG